MFTPKNFVFTILFAVVISVVGLYIIGSPGIITSGAYMVLMFILHETIRATLDEVYAGHLRKTYLKVGAFLIGTLLADIAIGYLMANAQSDLVDLMTRAQALVGTAMILLLGIFFAKLGWRDTRKWLTAHEINMQVALQLLGTVVIGISCLVLAIVHAPAVLIGGFAITFVWFLMMDFGLRYLKEEPFALARSQRLYTVVMIACLLTGIYLTVIGRQDLQVYWLVAGEGVVSLLIALGLLVYLGGFIYHSKRK